MKPWQSHAGSCGLGAAAGAAAGAILLRLDDVRDHHPAWTALAAGLLLVALAFTRAALRVQPGWVARSGYVLSAVGVVIAFLGLLGTTVADDDSATGAIVAVALPIAVVGHVLFTLAIAFRQEFAALSTLAFIAAAVLFIVTATWTLGYAAGWLAWAAALAVEAVWEVSSERTERAARARVFS